VRINREFRNISFVIYGIAAFFICVYIWTSDPDDINYNWRLSIWIFDSRIIASFLISIGAIPLPFLFYNLSETVVDLRNLGYAASGYVNFILDIIDAWNKRNIRIRVISIILSLFWIMLVVSMGLILHFR
jgi:hypothetical protein